MKNTITVFTPTFNRAYCLGQCYQSLLDQTIKDFVWLIIDDGSSDNTKELVNSWIRENKITIQYQYQENQGMHGAHNTAYKFIETELNVCIDSDDYMPNDAIEKILSFWDQVPKNKKEKIAGIIGLDADTDGQIIGSKFPEDIETSTLTDLYQLHKIKGDKKIVYRTEVVKQYPNYPLFPNERFVPLGHLYQLIDQDFPLLVFNEVLCIVEYRQDGSSLNMFKQYRKNPRGFAFSRITEMKYAKKKSIRFKKAVHFVANNLLFGNINCFKSAPFKGYILVAYPFGFLLYLYILLKTR